MYQKVIVVGNLGGDPEMRYLPNGRAVTSFSIATNRRWNDQGSGETKEETTWFRVSLFGPRAETANTYLKKGQAVLVEGRLKPDPNTGGPRLWTGQDGTMRASFELTADTFSFVGGRKEGGYESEESFEGQAAREEDEIPF